MYVCVHVFVHNIHTHTYIYIYTPTEYANMICCISIHHWVIIHGYSGYSCSDSDWAKPKKATEPQYRAYVGLGAGKGLLMDIARGF